MTNWVVITFLVPFFWTLVSVLDTRLIRDEYEDACDDVLVLGIFQLLPWLLVLFGIIGVPIPVNDLLLYSCVAGGLFAFAFFWYRQVLSVSGNVVLVQILLNLSIFVVPFLAWIFLGEILVWDYYIWIFVVFFGVSLFLLDGKKQRIDGSRVIMPMVIVIFSLSLSMIVSKMAYSVPGTDFWSAFLFFSFGVTSTSFFIFAFGKKDILGGAQRIFQRGKNGFGLLLLTESFFLLGTTMLQKTISLTPSVSFAVMAISMVPVFSVPVRAVITHLSYVQTTKSFVTKMVSYKEQIGTIALGHTVKKGEEIFFDQFIYGAVSAYAVSTFGTAYGSLVVFTIMAPLSALFCYGYLRLYDWLKRDWFGFEAVKNVQHQFEGNRFIGKFLKLGDVAAFFVLSVYADPFMVTVYLRKEGNRFNGLTRKDYIIFWSSVIVSNAYWTLRWTVLVTFGIWLWRTVLAPLFAG